MCKNLQNKGVTMWVRLENSRCIYITSDFEFVWMSGANFDFKWTAPLKGSQSSFHERPIVHMRFHSIRIYAKFVETLPVSRWNVSAAKKLYVDLSMMVIIDAGKLLRSIKLFKHFIFNWGVVYNISMHSISMLYTQYQKYKLKKRHIKEYASDQSRILVADLS